MHPSTLCLPAALRGDTASLIPSPIASDTPVGSVQRTQRNIILGKQVGIPEFPPDSLSDILHSARPIHVPTMPLGV